MLDVIMVALGLGFAVGYTIACDHL